MEKTQLYKRTAPCFNLLHICIYPYVTHQVYQYLRRKNVEDSLMPPRSRQFRYDSLQDRTQVRLFRLYPGKKHDDIAGQLHTVSIEELRSTYYESISYVWGDPRNTVEIRVNSATDSSCGMLSITRNLAAALKRVRKVTEERLIWADGICINQTNVLERGHQVRLMRSIYEQAQLVCVWLGPGSRECTDTYAWVVFMFLDMLQDERRHKDIYRYIAKADDMMWRHLSHVLNRPWFRRIWILQEIGVAKAAKFYYGWASIDRNVLYRAFHVLATLIKDFSAVATLETHISWIGNLEKYFLFNLSKNLLTINKFDLFDSARCCGATDPRDMIYALMGHTIFSTDDGKDFLPIDYSHSRGRVYTELALKLLLEPWNPLQLLSLVKHTEGQGLSSDHLPSWVPAWDIKSPVQTLGRRKHTFDASRSLQQAFTASVNGICIQGYQVDTIQWQSHTLQSTDIPEVGEDMTMSLNFRSIVDAFVSLPINPDCTHLRSCVRTLIAADVYRDRQDLFCGKVHQLDIEAMFDFMEYVKSLLKRKATRGTGVTSVRVLQEILAKGYPDELTRRGLNFLYRPNNLDGPSPFSLEARKWCTGRRFFITAKGRFGLGPPVSQVGDLVYILAGAAVPFVLRRSPFALRRCFANASTTFHEVQLRGECYVDGIMSGESDLMLAEGETYLEHLHII